MNQKRLLIVSHQDPGHMTGGQGVVLRSIAIKAAAILRHPVDHLSMRLKGESEYQEYEKGQIRVTRLNVSDSDRINTPYQGQESQQFQRRSEFNTLARDRIKANYDPNEWLVYLNGFYAEALIAKDLSDYQTMFCYHLLLSMRLERTGELDNFLPQIVEHERQSVRASQLIQAISAEMGEEIVSLMPREEQAATRSKIHVIGNGVEDEWLDTPAQAESVTNRVVAWGRIAPEKGFQYLIEALDYLPEVELVLFGRIDDSERSRGAYREVLEQLAERRKNVKLDFRPDGIRGLEKIALVDSAALVVVPSLYEPFGVVILEALARGKPVVTTATAGAVDIMTTDQIGRVQYGYLLGLYNMKPEPLEISGAIKELLNSIGSFRNDAMRKHAEKYRWHDITVKLLNTIELAPHRSGDQ